MFTYQVYPCVVALAASVQCYVDIIIIKAMHGTCCDHPRSVNRYNFRNWNGCRGLSDVEWAGGRESSQSVVIKPIQPRCIRTRMQLYILLESIFLCANYCNSVCVCSKVAQPGK